jgi:hypothetical protein
MESRMITSRVELDDTLNQLTGRTEEGEPLIVELISPGGASLGIGLGRPESVLAFKSSSEPPYFQSVGDNSSQTTSNDVVVFYYQGQWTEFPAGALVPNESAREAIRIFFETGERPENVKWEEV